MSKRRWLVVVVLLLLMVAAFVWRFQPRQTVVLPGHASLTFAGVTFGTTKHVAPDQSWTRILAFLPKSLLNKFKVYPPFPVPASTNQLFIWFHDTPQNSPFLIQGPSIVLSLVDENGNESSSPNFFPITLPGSGPISSVQAVILSAFPRRARSFKLRFYAQDTPNKIRPLGEMTIPNPVSKDYPNWPASPLPVISTNAGVEVTLTKLLTGESIGTDQPVATNEEVWGSAFFKFKRDGKPCTDWAVDGMEFSDATGNQAAPSGWGYRQPTSNEGIFSFRTPLWPSESAWKLNVHFKHTENAKFDDKDIWTTQPLALPAISGSNSLNLKTNLHGVSLALADLVDETAMMPAETRKNYVRVRLEFNVSPLPPELRFDIASVTAEGEKEEEATSIGTSGSAGNGPASCTYLVPASTRTLTVKMAVYPALSAEFIAKPTVVK